MRWRRRKKITHINNIKVFFYCTSIYNKTFELRRPPSVLCIVHSNVIYVYYHVQESICCPSKICGMYLYFNGYLIRRFLIKNWAQIYVFLTTFFLSPFCICLNLNDSEFGEILYRNLILDMTGAHLLMTNHPW